MQDEKFKDEAQMARADRLRQARRRKHFRSMRAAADFHGWSPHTYSSHEKGARAFKYETAVRYATAFGVGVEWLWNGPEAEAQSRERSFVHSCNKMNMEAEDVIVCLELAIEKARRLRRLGETLMNLARARG
jgi:DNA-binding XRE family transcriptional regulator